MFIRLAALADGTNTVHETSAPEEIGLDAEIFHSPVELTGEVHRSENGFDFRLHVATEGDFVCDRCAVGFRRTVESDIRLLAVRRTGHAPREREAEGLVTIGMHDAEINLDQEILDALILGLPMKILCREDCRGLCPRCGADLNEGPCGCENTTLGYGGDETPEKL